MTATSNLFSPRAAARLSVVEVPESSYTTRGSAADHRVDPTRKMPTDMSGVPATSAPVKDAVKAAIPHAMGGYELTMPTEVALAGSVIDRFVNRLASRRSGAVEPLH